VFLYLNSRGKITQERFEMKKEKKKKKLIKKLKKKKQFSSYLTKQLTNKNYTLNFID
jgi:hypothetical protein